MYNYMLYIGGKRLIRAIIFVFNLLHMRSRSNARAQRRIHDVIDDDMNRVDRYHPDLEHGDGSNLPNTVFEGG